MASDRNTAARAGVEETRRVKVWDAWVRLTHWAIVLLLPFSYWTATTSRYDLHFVSGYAILSLVLFRILWGLIGSETARFRHFLRGPGEALRHLAHLVRRETPWDVGHNAAGGWMVVLLLLLLLAQAVSGLFADDLIFTRGPLARRVEEVWSSRATSVHLRVYWLIFGFAALHILAVLAYRIVVRRNLVKPMITGAMEMPANLPATAPRMGSPALAVALLAACAGLSWWISTLKPASMF
jgi:cytochrome b